MFPEEALFEYVLEGLADELANYHAPEPDPLPCDRWIARSALQKTIRRGEIEIAHRALANLLVHDPRSIWRHLTIIALEDVGVAGIDVVVSVVAASRGRPWRTRMGGDWRVASYLVRQMCEAQHCQAACDLLLRAINDPVLGQERSDALVAMPPKLLHMVADRDLPLMTRGVVALALGGGLFEHQPNGDAMLLFDALEGQAHSSHVVATCRAAYRVSRNPMAILLPLVWQRWMASDGHAVIDDEMPPVTMINGVPGYALDQFTRVGGAVARSYLKADLVLKTMLDDGGIPFSRQSQLVGDLLFLAEGGLARRRAVWSEGDILRLPHRMLPAAAELGEAVQPLLSRISAQGSVIASLRAQHLQRSHI